MGKINLKDFTFCIPIFFDSYDRVVNLKISIDYLRTFFDTNIIIGEEDVNGFYSFNEIECDAYYDYKNITNGLFHRTKILNRLFEKSKTKYVVNYDSDVFFDIEKYVESAELIRSGYDVIYPYDGKFLDFPRFYLGHLKNFTQSISEIIDISRTHCRNPNSLGGALFLNKQRVMDVGGENEEFISWGYEDLEREWRFKEFGLSIKRLEGSLYHLEHFKGNNSSRKNPLYHTNKKVLDYIMGMDKTTLKEYVESWKRNRK